MEKPAILLMAAIFALTACNKSAVPDGAKSPASTAKADALQQKLLEYSGNTSTDCGRLDVHAAETQLKATSDCAMQAAQAKRAFYVAYDMPGMSVGVAGNAAGNLFSVQSQSGGSTAGLTGGACPSQLRVASSGR